MDAAFIGTLFSWSNTAAVFGLNLFIHTTVIIAAGFIGVFVLTRLRKGAAAVSFTHRLSLCAVLASPILVAAVLTLGPGQFYYVLRLPVQPAHTERTVTKAVPAPSSSEKPARISSRATGTPSPDASVTIPSALPSAPSPIRPGARVSESGPSPAPITPAAADAKQHMPFLAYIGVMFSALWITLSLFMLLRACAIMTYVRRIRFLALPALPEYTETCRAAARELDMPVPDVLQSPYVSSAFITGIRRPAVLLPIGANESAMATREVFLHELAHIIRHDHFWLLMGQTAKILFPFQPFLWLLIRRLEEASDYACDNYVLNHTGEDRTYAARLFDLAIALQPGGPSPAAGTGILSGKSSLRRRIEHILDNSYARHISPNANETMSIALLFVCAITLTGFVGFRSEASVPLHEPYGHGMKSSSKPFPFRMPLVVAAPVSRTTVEKKAVAEAPSEDAQPSPEAVPVRSMDTAPAPSPSSPAPMDTDTVETAGTSGAVHETIETAGIADALVDVLPVTIPTPEAKPADAIPEASIQRSPEKSAARTTAAAIPMPAPAFLGARSSSGASEEAAAKPGHLDISIPSDAPAELRESLERGQKNPVWSPTGRIIAFTGDGGNGIWAVSVRGGKPSLVCDTTSGEKDRTVSSAAKILCFSPSGDVLTYVRYESGDMTGAAAKIASGDESVAVPVIETVNLMNGTQRELVRNAIDGRWSADGRYFVFVEADNTGIGVLDTTAGTRRLLSPTGLSPCMAQDGASIIYVDQTKKDWYDLFQVSLSGGAPVQLTTDGNWWEPECSPDGEWVLSSNSGALTQGSRAMLRAFNLRVRTTYFIYVETTGSAEMGTWSPDGRQFCYTRAAGTAQDGGTSAGTAIYISDFQPPESSGSSSETAKPAVFGLLGNYPNPFNPSTTIRFSLHASGPAELVIYNIMGQKIRELVSGRMEAGAHSVVWNGRNKQGSPVSSGIYIAQLKMEGKVESRRMTLVK